MITVEKLKEVLKDVPNEYEVDIWVNEEGSSLNHVFIDNDCGVVELTDFVDDESGEFSDKFAYRVDTGDHVIVVVDNVMECATVGDIVEANDDTVDVALELRDQTIISMVFSKNERNKNIVRFDW